jgi:hypothetical protein
MDRNRCPPCSGLRRGTISRISGGVGAFFWSSQQVFTGGRVWPNGRPSDTRRLELSIEIPDPDLEPVNEFCRRVGGISRTSFYEMRNAGLIATVKIGCRTYIRREERERFLRSLEGEAAA